MANGLPISPELGLTLDDLADRLGVARLEWKEI
jgi:hypothetical protein